MKKIFALLSLIAILTVVFTSQTLANDHTVIMATETQSFINVAVDTVNRTDCGVENVNVNIVSRDLYNTIFKAEMINTWKDLPFEVGWTIEKSNIINKAETITNTYKDLPIKVGWSN